MPAGVEKPGAFHLHMLGAFLELLKFLKRLKEVCFSSEDSNELLHRVLQIMMDCIRRFASGVLKRRQHFSFSLVDLRIVDRRLPHLLGALRRRQAGTPAEYEEVGKRISPQAVRAMQARGNFAGG